MQKIFTLILDQNDQLQNIYIDADFTIQHQITYVETEFIKYIIQRQFKVGLDEFIDVSPARMMKVLGYRRVTVMNAFRKFRDANIIYQLKFRSPEWKLNYDMFNIVKQYNCNTYKSKYTQCNYADYIKNYC